MKKSKLYHITYEKEFSDSIKLIEKIKEDNWVDANTILVTCSPDYSSGLTQLINHKLSHLNGNELYEQLFLEMPYPIMTQIWNRDTQQYEIFDKYLTNWVNRYIDKEMKYLFVDSATLRGKNFTKVKSLIRTRLDNENYRFASTYLQKGSLLIPDYYVEEFSKEDKGGIIFQWENVNNKNWDY